ncbi:PREDICTED: transmembrane protein 208-like [Papilio polytes]|uniref:transmembrane protein 208-like n=1 Tax=Papilio polytes TaxID=76194 RepID=UPI0006768391|nr:PREDICTED: transmembrane protein 208-like [Papilio polytes]
MPARRKQPTRGGKQIIAENEATVRFYRNMSLVCGAIYNTVFYFFFYDHMCPLVMCMNILVTVIYVSCYHFMRHITRPEYSMQTYQLLDPGHDLNMDGGIGEHVKDVVIVASVTHLLALFSNKFWLTLVIIPLKALWLFWVNVLGPWLDKDDLE